MDGYSSYLKGFEPKPQYTRTVIHPWSMSKPLFPWLEDRGVIVESEQRTAKILSAADGAHTFSTKDGGFVEVMQDKATAEYIIIEISPNDAEAYKRYKAPLPLWAYLQG